MAASDIWFPLYISDYLRDTMRLNTEQHGAYLLLLFSFWVDGGTMPDDNQQFAAICRCDETRWTVLIRPALERFFTIENGTWTQQRVVAEKLKAISKSQIRSEVGKLGGRPKNQTESKPKANGYREAKLIESPSQSQSPSQSESESEPHTHPDKVCMVASQKPPDEPETYPQVEWTPDTKKASLGAQEIIRFFNEVLGTQYREAGASFQIVHDRLSEPDVDVEGCKVMIRHQIACWKGTKMEKHLTIHTLFEAKKFDSYWASRLTPAVKWTDTETRKKNDQIL